MITAKRPQANNGIQSHRFQFRGAHDEQRQKLKIPLTWYVEFKQFLKLYFAAQKSEAHFWKDVRFAQTNLDETILYMDCV